MIRISWGYIYNHILPDINLSHNFLFRQEPISQHHVDGKLCDMVGGEPGDTAGQRGDTRPVTRSTNERPCVPALVTRSINQKTRVPALLTLATNQSKEGQKGTKETNPTNMFYCLLVWRVRTIWTYYAFLAFISYINKRFQKTLLPSYNYFKTRGLDSLNPLNENIRKTERPSQCNSFHLYFHFHSISLISLQMSSPLSLSSSSPFLSVPPPTGCVSG